MSHHGSNPFENNPLLRKMLQEAPETGDPLKDMQRKLQCEYPYRPTECRDYMKLKLPENATDCSDCNGSGWKEFPLKCRSCNGCGVTKP